MTNKITNIRDGIPPMPDVSKTGAEYRRFLIWETQSNEYLEKTKSKYPNNCTAIVGAYIPYTDYKNNTVDYVCDGYRDTDRIIVWKNTPSIHELDVEECEEGVRKKIEYRILVELLMVDGTTDKEIEDYLSINNEKLSVAYIEL